MELVGEALGRLLLFGLVLARTGSAMALLPLFGAGVIPLAVRAGLSGVMAIALLPVAGSPPLPRDLLAYLALAAREVTVGAGMGFLARLVLTAVELGGALMDLQAGFGLAQLFEVSVGEQLPVFGSFLMVLALLVLFVSGGHQLILVALAASFRRWPVGSAWLLPSAGGLVSTLAWAFAAALGLASVVLGVGLIASLFLALLARAMPQLNLWAFGLPVQAGAALVSLLLALPVALALLRLLGSEAASAMAAVVAP